MVVNLPAWLRGPNAGQVRKTETGTVPRRTIRRSPLAQQLPDLWWKRQQRQSIRALEKRDECRRLHVVCPSTLIATRHRCGGACREELGDLRVAFFLSSFLCITLWGKDVVQ
jgi:hypothetical protein